MGDGESVRAEAYGGVPVTWTMHLWRPDDLAALVADAGLEPVARMGLPAPPQSRPGVVFAARRPG